MSLVSKVGRKSLKARLAMGLVYLLLVVGATTTLYPFLLMASGALKGPTDQNDNRLVPAYFSDPAADKDLSLLGKYLADKYSGNAEALVSSRLGPSADPATVAKFQIWLSQLPPDRWSAGFRTAPNQITGKLALRYQAWLRTWYPTVNALNSAYGEQNGAFQQVVPPPERWEDRNWKPNPDLKWREWLEFKRSLPVEFRIPIRAQRIYQDYWKSQTKGQFKDVPSEVAQGATKFSELALPTSGPHFEAFQKDKLPPRYAGPTPEQGWSLAVGSAVPMPIAAMEEGFVRDHRSELTGEFATRNFRFVLDYVLINGQVLWNTALYCLLAVAAHLIVNPLAAYALSRYPIRASSKILLFLLATMAFPAEVAMIPSFLLLKDLGLLNTYAALVLPGAASGYMIYLLKGFFDSLPQELFEAGQLDGAREGTLMWRVALPLSRPVLGYVALVTFMGAYGAFMYAFLVAQDRKLWTLMVWIYQLQGTAPKAVMLAALTLAAAPTLAVFLMAQKVILRGIVLPGER